MNIQRQKTYTEKENKTETYTEKCSKGNTKCETARDIIIQRTKQRNEPQHIQRI